MSAFDAERYAAGLRHSNARERQHSEQRLKDAQIEAVRLIQALKETAGCTDACLFGSVADNSVRRIDFDIDIAVWGGDILLAEGIADTSPFTVDIVQYEYAPKHLQRRIDGYR